MDNKFFTLIKPYLSFIDSGKLYRKPFSWLYMAIAVLNLLFPFYVLYDVIDRGALIYADAKIIFSFVFALLVLIGAGWISFQIWWDRKDKVLQTTVDGVDFPSTPVISHFIQTVGEWFGTWLAVAGVGCTFFALICFGYNSYEMSYMLDLPLYTGIEGIILMPIAGFLVIIFSRLIAEQIRALATVANNTKK
jgi:hypothetical protein